MKDLFTYPSNPSTHYIDPDYVGDANSGMQKRVNDLRTGSYRGWSELSPTNTTDELMEVMSKYHNNFLESWGENTIYKFWVKPLIEFRMREKGVSVKDISIVPHEGIAKILVDCDANHNFAEGTQIYIRDEVTAELDDPTALYVERIDNRKFYLRRVATKLDPPTRTEYIIAEYNNTRYDNRHFGDNLNARARRYGNGAIVSFNHAPNFDNNSIIRLMSSFSDPNDTGTLNSTTTDFYVTRLGGSSYTYEVFTDSGKTTRADLNEHYIDTGTRQYTSAVTVDLEDQLFSDWGITTTTQFQSEGNGWCRITASVTAGTFTGADDSSRTIPETKSYSLDFYWVCTSPTEFTIYDVRSVEAGVPEIQDFIIGGANPDVTVTIEFIDPARTQAGWARRLIQDTTDSAAKIDKHSTIRYEVGAVDIYLPGNETFTYQDANNNTQNGCKFIDQWFPGDTSATALDSDESLPDGSIITLSNGRVSGSSLPEGPHDNRGNFDTSTTRMFTLDDADDLYVAPTQTIAEQQDNWEFATQWDSTGSGAPKSWPKHVSPSGAKVTYNTPTQVSVSQGGVKYARGSGFTRWQLEVSYPPMSKEDFAAFHTTAQLAQGQYMPFYFDLRSHSGENILFDYHKAGVQTQSRVKTDSNLDKTILLEGFTANTTGALTQGELLIVGDTDNGGVNTVAVTQDANAFGEVLAKFTFIPTSTKSHGQMVYADPAHVIVTMSQNGFEYEVDTAERYYMTVKFDLDYWK